MPTIEIVAVGRKNRIKLPKGKYPFWVDEERQLVSHRRIFQDYLDRTDGVIMHLCNMHLSKDWFTNASDLINWDFGESIGEDCPDNDKYFRFKEEYIHGIKNLLGRAHNGSPRKMACLLTDYQFGPQCGDVIRLKFNDLWNQHDNEGLVWNTLYETIE